MRLTVLRTITAIGCFLTLSGKISAQNCNRSTINGTTINLLCNQVCTTLVFQVPHLKSTSDYIIRPITYNPYAYSTPTGNNIAGPPYILSTFFDDQWTSKIPITFPFCFYGITYPTLLIGTNSAITFDTSRALTGSGFSISAPPTGAIPTTSYAPAMIFGPYHDIDIDQPTGPNKRIEFRIECTAPNRRFIASYSEIPFFGSSCNTNIATHQMVLYESTGIIEVYIQDKPSCTGWNGGRAILGVQDHTRLNAVAAAGKNATVWNESNTAYRFIPSGGPSRYLSSQILDMSGNLVVAGDTATTTSGMLDLSFPNICVPSGSNQYQVVTTFADCANPAANYVVTDTITVARTNSIGATNTFTAATCGNNNGTITVNLPAGVGTAPFSYVLDGGVPVVTPSLTHTFTGVASGPHIVTVTDASTGCTSTLNVTVTLVGNLLANTASTATACAAVNNNGTITVTPTVGTAPFTYVIDGGAPVTGGSPYTFTGLSSGNHTITFTDVNGCTSNPIIVNVATGAGITSHGVTSTATSCAGASNGSITVTSVTGGTAPYEYQLGAAPFQPSNVFTGLASGTYTITIRDVSGCTRTFNRTVTNGSSVTATTALTATSCSGAANGSVIVTPTNGTGPYTFVLDGVTTQTGATNTTFTNLTPGAHSVVITDNPTGCLSNTINFTITAGAVILANAVPAATSCSGAADGTITVTPTTGTAPYTYSLDGGAFVPGVAPYTYTNLSSGAHTIRVTDANGCVTNVINVNIAAGPILAATAAPSATSCSGATNGSITVTPTNGNAPYTFSLDGAPAVAGAAPYTYTNVPAGAHTIVMADAAGCITNVINVNVAAGPSLTTTVNKTDVLCNAGATGSITVTQPTIGNPPYEYSLDNVTWQSGTTFSGLAAGTYTVYYRELNGCVGSQQITITEPPVLDAVAASVPVVCNGQSNGIITMTSTGGVAPHEYSIDGGANWVSGNVFNVAAGTYTIITRDVNGCTFPRTITVTEPAVLAASFITSNASCDGGNDGVIDVSVSGGNSGYQYSIDNGVTWQASNIFNVAPGSYVILVKDNLNCTTTVNATVGLSNNLTFTAQTDPTICESRSAQLDLVSNATQYLWSPATGLSDTTIHNPVANPVATTTYTVIATLGRCSATDIVTVNVNAAPIPDAGADGFICYGQTYQLQAAGGTVYSWTPTTYLNNPNIANPISTPIKDITYTVTILSDVNGCASLVTDQMVIDVTPPLKVKTFPYDTIGYPGDQFQLLAVSSDPDANIFTWTPATNLSNPNIANPIVTIGPIGSDLTYQVITSTIAGCKGEGYVHVKVYKGPDIYVPTGFTPNGDGRNDRFTPFPVGIKGLNYFKVFNRWGQLVFSTTKLHDGWDGKLSGRDQPTGTYVWMAEGISNQGKLITKKGVVTLIR